MTTRLEQAFTEASKLPPKEQDALADWVLAELHSEKRWDRLFAGSQKTLSKLASEALAEHRRGQTSGSARIQSMKNYLMNFEIENGLNHLVYEMIQYSENRILIADSERL